MVEPATQPLSGPVLEDAPVRKGSPTQPIGPGAPAKSPYDAQRPGGSGPRKPRRGAFWWILAAVVLAGVVVYAIFFHGDGGQGSQAGGPGGRRGGRAAGGAPVSVNIAKVVRSDVPIYLNGLGTVTPLATVTVRPQIAGQITKIAFQEGQMVKAGQFLAEIDPRPAEQALLQAEGVLARDEANLKNGQVLLQRDQTLLTQDSIARQDVDNQEATVRSLEATIKTDQAAISAAKLNLEYTHITAPVAGRVGLRQVDLGNYVTVGQTTGIVVITEISPIDVVFTFAEDSLPQVTARLRAGATLAATAFDRAQNNQLAQGKLLTLDNLIDTTTGTVKVKARFPNGDGALFPNQFVNVRILVDTVKNAVTVPSSAVLRGANGLIVYVVKPDHTVTVRNVQAGPVAGQTTSITSGLQVGETVVIDGTDRLREGSRVVLPGECPPGGGARRGRNGQAGPGGQGGGAAAGQGGAGRRGGQGCRPGAGGGAGFGAGAASAGGFGGAGQAQPAGTNASAAQQIAPSSAVAGGAPGDRQPGAEPSANAGGEQAGGEQGGGEGRRGGGGMRLLSQLGLDPNQQAKVDAIMQEARQTAQSTDDPDARRQAMQGAMARIAPILRPDQKAKLDALRAQQRANGGGQGGNAGQN